jgi:hypothetical protein
MKSFQTEEHAMNVNEKYASEARKQKARRRLGSDNPRCGMCGEGDARVLESHHIAGRKHHKSTTPICRNCHRKLSDAQRDHPQAIEGGGTLETIGHFLLGLADLLAIAVAKLREFGRQLIDEAKARCANVKGAAP